MADKSTPLDNTEPTAVGSDEVVRYASLDMVHQPAFLRNEFSKQKQRKTFSFQKGRSSYNHQC
jgi:hypothetical protein